MKFKLAQVSRSAVALLGAAAVALSTACSSKDKAKENTESASAPPAASSQTAAEGPTDADIAHIVVTADTIDIQAGELAKAKSKNKQVKDFATHMITDHTAVNKQASELAARLGVTPKDNPASQGLRAGADKNMAHLRQQSGKDFDRAYVESEVAFHQTVLDAIDNLLVPNAKNEELKALIVKVRPVIAAHMDHAKKLHASLAKK